MEKPLEYSPTKILGTLFASQIMTTTAMIMGATVASIEMVALAGGNKSWTGVPVATQLIGEAVMAYPASRLMDWAGRRLGLSMGHVLGAVGASIVGFAVFTERIPVFLLGILTLGFARGALDMGRYAAADATLPDRRARAISFVVLGGTVGSVAGPSLLNITGGLAEALGLPAIVGSWLLMAIFFVAAFLIMMIFLHPDPRDIARQIAAQHSGPHESLTPARPISELLRQPQIQLAIGGLISTTLSMITVMVITPVHMIGNEHTVGDVSLVFTGHTLGMFGISIATGWLVDRVGRVPMILIGGVLSTIACVIAPLSLDTLWLALSLFLLGLGWNFTYVASSTLLDENLSVAEKARGRGTADAMVKVASMVGALGSGLLFAQTTYTSTSWLTIIVAVLPVVLAVFALTRQRREVAAQTAGR